MSSVQEVPRLFSVTWAILGPCVLLINSGLIPQPSGVYPPADYADMTLAALLMLAGWSLEGPTLVRWVRRKLDRDSGGNDAALEENNG